MNVNVPVCVAWHCKTGDVEQSNRNTSGDAAAWNANHTGQSNEQSQKGVGGDARSGDAETAEGGCCDHGSYQKPKHGSYDKPKHGSYEKPKHRCGGCEEHGKSRCDDPCHESKPKHVCKDGGNARSGDAKGGDVDQRQHAQNDNRTEQKAGAASIAEQVIPINVAFAKSPWQQTPRCGIC